MLVMPILNTSKNGVTKIYNVEVKLKTATKVKKDTSLKGFEESDIIVNGSSFKKSIYNSKKQDYHVITNFIRNHNYHSDRKDFLITTRTNSNSNLYDLYSVEVPLKKVTVGLDNLYGKVIVDMQKEIPNIKKGRCLSLNELGVDEHITDDKIDRLKYLVTNVTTDSDLDYILYTNNLGNLKSTIEFIKQFDFTIISEATITEEQVKNLLEPLQYTYSQHAKSLGNYYKTAKSNQDTYRKLSIISQILYSKPINLIQNKEKQKVFMKKTEGKLGVTNDQKAA